MSRPQGNTNLSPREARLKAEAEALKAQVSALRAKLRLKEAEIRELKKGGKLCEPTKK